MFVLAEPSRAWRAHAVHCARASENNALKTAQMSSEGLEHGEREREREREHVRVCMCERERETERERERERNRPLLEFLARGIKGIQLERDNGKNGTHLEPTIIQFLESIAPFNLDQRMKIKQPHHRVVLQWGRKAFLIEFSLTMWRNRLLQFRSRDRVQICPKQTRLKRRLRGKKIIQFC